MARARAAKERAEAGAAGRRRRRGGRRRPQAGDDPPRRRRRDRHRRRALTRRRRAVSWRWPARLGSPAWRSAPARDRPPRARALGHGGRRHPPRPGRRGPRPHPAAPHARAADQRARGATWPRPSTWSTPRPRACPPLDLRLGPVATFAPVNPVAYLAVAGEAEPLAHLVGLKDALHAGPLDRPADFAFVPHVTVAASWRRSASTRPLVALADYARRGQRRAGARARLSSPAACGSRWPTRRWGCGMTATTAARTDGAAAPDRRRLDLPLPWLLLGTLVAYVPFVLLGYGTDVDVANVLRAGRSAARRRLPHLPGPGRRAPRGGHRRAGPPRRAVPRQPGRRRLRPAGHLVRPPPAAATRAPAGPAGPRSALAANPWFWLASTSLGDFTWSLSLGPGRRAGGLRGPTRPGRRALRAGHRMPGLDGAPGAGRGSSPSGRARRRPVGPGATSIVTAAATLVVGALCFVPPWLSTDRSARLPPERARVRRLGDAPRPLGGEEPGHRHDPGRRSCCSSAGATSRAALRRWRLSVVVRFAVLTIVAMEVLFFRLPFKPVHLLPVIAAMVLLAGTARLDRRRWLIAARGGRSSSPPSSAPPSPPPTAPTTPRPAASSLRPADGVIVNDVRCRLADLEPRRVGEGRQRRRAGRGHRQQRGQLGVPARRLAETRPDRRRRASARDETRATRSRWRLKSLELADAVAGVDQADGAGLASASRATGWWRRGCRSGRP